MGIISIHVKKKLIKELQASITIIGIKFFILMTYLAAKRLGFFADYFNTVEINNTFYRIPSKKAIEDWSKKGL